MRRRWHRWGVIGLLGLAVVLGGWRLLVGGWLDREAALAGQEMGEGRFAAARDRLRRVVRARPGDADLAYALGACEERLGDHDAAAAAWARVPPGAALGARAAVARARVLTERGRYAEAEAALVAALPRPCTGPEAAMVREWLVLLVRTEGRSAEVGPLIEQVWALVPKEGPDPRWREVSPPLDLLRRHVAIDLEPAMAEDLRRTLAEAERRAPGDDRVALGLANLATLEGRFGDADRRLLACEAKRPGDPAVARARLDWAIARGDSARARDAIAGLPGDGSDPVEVLTWRAWFAQRRADAAAERAALEQVLARQPASARALERLAELAAMAGDPDRARSLRARKAGLDAIRDRYRAGCFRADIMTRTAELAGWAEALGRTFEARGWWTLRLGARSDDPAVRANLARLARAPAPTKGPTLADLRAELARDARATAEQAPGGPVPCDSLRFEDDAGAAGLRFVHDKGETPERQLPETMGGGVGLLDYDGDGRLDVYCVQGGPLVPNPASTATATPPGDRLFRNRGDGTFEDVTEAAGLAGRARGFGNGVAVGDVDNDGRPDLLVTRLDAYGLYRNRGDGTFEDATAAAGLGGPRDWPTSAAFADLDGDGDLDLYVCHYAAWDVLHPRLCHRADGSASYCRPQQVEPARDRLFRNDGGRFVDVTSAAGIVDDEGRGLGVLAADLDGDGRVDLFVANDTTANYLWRNLGGMRFEDVGLAAGVACSASGGFQAGMGVACGDLDGDGRLDVAVTNFFGESTSLFQNLGGGMFADRTAATGLLAATRHLLGFGTEFLDADNDGHLDLLTVNGHVTDSRPDFPYKMPAQLLAGDGRGRLHDVSGGAGEVFRVPRLGRGLAVGDLDNDGRCDAVAIDQDRPLVYFHNRSRAGHWIRFTLEGTDSNRDGVGAVVAIEAGGRRRVAARLGGGSYQSASDRRVHFGLGTTDRVESVAVAWPSGRVDRFANLTVDADYRLRERSTVPLRLRSGSPGR